MAFDPERPLAMAPIQTRHAYTLRALHFRRLAARAGVGVRPAAYRVRVEERDVVVLNTGFAELA